MKGIKKQSIIFFVCFMAFFPAICVNASPCPGPCLLDVTPHSLCLAWADVSGRTPAARIYSDATGETDITESLFVEPFPIRAGDPDKTAMADIRASKNALKTALASRGLYTVKISGLRAGTVYYLRACTADENGVRYFRPENGLLFVETPLSATLEKSAPVMLVTLSDDYGTDDFSGCLVCAFTRDAAHGVLACAGDGADKKTAYLNIGRLLGGGGRPDSADILVAVLTGDQPFPVLASVSVQSDVGFAVCTAHSENIAVSSGDSGELFGIIISLGIAAENITPPCSCLVPDIGNDARKGVPEGVYLMEKAAGAR